MICKTIQGIFCYLEVNREMLNKLKIPSVRGCDLPLNFCYQMQIINWK